MYGDVMRTRKYVQKEEDRLIEQGERIRLAQQYPTSTCLYAGEELRLRIVFNEEVEPDWDTQAQEYIDINKGRACCLHKGKYHLLYY